MRPNRVLAKQACFDCHSNETEWPAYASIAPASWLVQRDVNEGRAVLNFSEWRRPRRKRRRPPKKYWRAKSRRAGLQLVHAHAHLSAGNRDRLAQGLATPGAGFQTGGARTRTRNLWPSRRRIFQEVMNLAAVYNALRAAVPGGQLSDCQGRGISMAHRNVIGATKSGGFAPRSRGQRRHRVHGEPGGRRRRCRRRPSGRLRRGHGRPRRRCVSMAAGEYVSVSSQADTEQADLKRERHELHNAPGSGGGQARGQSVVRDRASPRASVARQLTASGALAAHARDELG